MLEAPEEVSAADLRIHALFAAEEEVVFPVLGRGLLLADLVVFAHYRNERDRQQRDRQHEQPVDRVPRADSGEAYRLSRRRVRAHDALGIACAEHAVDVIADVEHRLGRGLGEILSDPVREDAAEDADCRKQSHRKAHPEGDFLDVFILGGQLAEEHRLRDLYKGRKRQHGGDERDNGHEQEADVAALDRLHIGCLIDHPLGGEAVEGRHAAYRCRADQEQHRGVRHFL